MVVFRIFFKNLSRRATLIIGLLSIILPVEVHAASGFCAVQPDNTENGIIVATPELACAAVSGRFYTTYSGSNTRYYYTVDVTVNYEAFYGQGMCTGTYTNEFGEAKYIELRPYCYCQTDDLSSSPNHIPVRYSDFRNGKCGNALSLTLTPAPNQTPPDPRPVKAEGKDGKSTLELIAKVMEGSTPKAGVAVTFKVEVVPMTGGHGHHDANRPKGSVPASGVTDAKGEIKLTFKASEVAGSHNITATCDSCSNKTVDKKVDVRAPDLAPISPNPSKNADGSYQYAFTAVDPGHVGTSGGRQRGEYYLTEEATANLRELIKQFAKEGWGIVALNDASLSWGGVYDLNNNWRPPHSTHRTGEDIDISFTRVGNPISKKKQSEFYDKFCEDKKVSIPFTILHHYQAIPHFHVYLMGQKQCAKTTN